METTGYKGGSKILRQETFETDPKYTNRSKSGSVRRGDLSLPVIGPRHLIRQNSADARTDKPTRRALSPDTSAYKEIQTDKTYTKSLLGQKPTEDLSNHQKVLNRLNRKKVSESIEDIKPKEERKTVKHKKIESVKAEKNYRKTDTKSVESGDSSKENKLHSVLSNNSTSALIKESKRKTVKNLNSGISQKENKLQEKALVTENNISTKESKVVEKKSLDTNLKEKKIKSNENKSSNNHTLLNEKEIKSTGNKTLVNKKSTNRLGDNKASDKTKTTVPAEALDSPQLKRKQKSDKDDNEKSKIKREKLRDKLTSTPVSNFDSDFTLKSSNQTVSKVQVKENRSNDKGKKEDDKKLKEIQTEKVSQVKFNTKQEKLEETSKVENKQLKVQTTIRTDPKRDELKRIQSKSTSGSSSVPQANKFSTTEKRQKQLKAKDYSTEHKQSVESLESGFASYRQTDNKDVQDAISILSHTDTEVGKPPENTALDRPRSDKSKVSQTTEHSRPVSNKSKDFVIPQEKAEKSKDYREFEKNRPPSRGLSSEGVQDINYRLPRRMEPSIQRKPGAERMTETYDSIYEERRTLLAAEVAYKKRIKQLEDELNQFLKTIEDLRSENKALRNRIDSLENSDKSGSQHEIEKLKVTVQSLETQNKVLETSHEKTEAKVSKLEQERDKLTSDKKNLTSKLKESEDKCSSVEKELEKLKSDNSSTSKTTEQLDEELKKLHIDLRMEQSERKKVENENTILKTDKDVLKDEIAALKSINKNLEAMNEEFKDANASMGEFPNKEKMELKSQIIKLQTDNQTLNEENIKLKAENIQQVKSIHDLEKTAKTFESSVTAVESEKLTQIQDLQNENAKLKSDIKDLKETFADADSKIKSLESANKALDEDLTQKKSELTELLSALKDDDKFDNEIKSLKADNIRLQQENDEKDKAAADSKRHLDEIKIEKDKFETEKDKLTKKINEMLEINEGQKKQMTQVQEKLESVKKELESNKEKLQLLQKYENEITELKTKLQNIEKEKEKLLKQKQEEIEELKLKMERNDAENKEQTEAMKIEYEKEIDELKKQVEFLQKEIDELRQLKAIESELLETKDELQNVKKKYSEMVVELESKSDLEQKNFQMNVRMTQMNNTIKQLERDQKEWLLKKQQIDEIEASNKRLQEENTKLKQRGGVHKVSKQIDKQLEFLERKQKDAETRVKQLEGWVGDLYDDDKHNQATYVGSLQSKKHTKKKQAFTKAPKLPQTTVRIDHERPRSLDDVIVKEKEKYERSVPSEKLSNRSSPSLPAIEPETRLTFGLGYSQIHRSRIKAAQKYRKF